MPLWILPVLFFVPGQLLAEQVGGWWQVPGSGLGGVSLTLAQEEVPKRRL